MEISLSIFITDVYFSWQEWLDEIFENQFDEKLFASRIGLVLTFKHSEAFNLELVTPEMKNAKNGEIIPRSHNLSCSK